ncbi:hypothetical protein EDD85DRAFT_989024 [Armillaria nabsnona]|nr:hypothetical protein EDD85DRAFT_989024 [Armillaria nabsnona]
MKMLLLIVLSCFAISHGFRFDNLTETLTVGIPITLSWHRDANNSKQIDISLLNYLYPFINTPQVTTLKSAADIPQPYGTLNMTIPNSGLYLVEAHNAGTVVANTGAFDVKPPSENGGGGSSTMPSYLFIPAYPDHIGPFCVGVRRVIQVLQSTETAPPESNSTHQNGKASIVIGTVIGSLVSLLLLLVGGTFLFIRKRRQRNLNRGLLPNPKIIPEIYSHSPPLRNENSEIVSPTPAREVVPHMQDGSCETAEDIPGGNPTDGGRERGNSIRNPDASDPQSEQQQERLQAAFDVVSEVFRFRTQFQQFIVEWEAERVRGGALDLPPAYA